MSQFEIDLIRHVKVDGKPALYGSTDIKPLAAENERLLAQLITQQNTSKAYHNVICSPLQRCQSLAMKFAQSSQLPLHICDNLQEMNFGDFDGIPFDEMVFKGVIKEAKETTKVSLNEKSSTVQWSLLEKFFQDPAATVLPEGELLVDFYQRVIQAWQCLVEQQLTFASEQKQTSQSTSSHLKITQRQSSQSQSTQRQNSESQSPRRVLVVAHGGVIRMILAHILQLDWRQASWHQQLHIGHASLTRVCLSQPYDNEKILQQITTIAMPFLKEQD